MSLNPYAPPAADSKEPLAADFKEPLADEGLGEDEIGAYVGRNERYYWRAWQRLRVRGGFRAGFNIAAFFLSFFWLLYRKMYREFFFAIAPPLVFGFVEALLSVHGDAERSLDRALSIGVASAAAILGNGLYLRRAERAIKAARREERDPGRRLALLRREGGTTFLWPLVLGAAMIAVSLAGVLLG